MEGLTAYLAIQHLQSEMHQNISELPSNLERPCGSAFVVVFYDSTTVKTVSVTS